jgi:Ni/Co efflux regulator RcnB
MTIHTKTSTLLRRSRNFALVAAVALASASSFAEKPEWAGGGKGEKGDKGGNHTQGDKSNKQHGKQQDRQQDRPHIVEGPSARNSSGPRPTQVRVGGYFGDQQRGAARTYYGNEFQAGRCPPGLAKKKNGCMPPGQAKKYSVGQRLPGNVVYYQVPQQVIYQLGAPPSGYRYVRVASDILLLAIGTGMVVDAIQNLSGY